MPSCRACSRAATRTGRSCSSTCSRSARRSNSIGPGATPLYGFRRESAWFPRDGRFVKSPLRVDGVTISEENRRKFEDEWLKREDMREKRRAERAAKGDSGPENTSTTPLDGRRREAGARAGLRLRRLLPQVQVRPQPLRPCRTRAVRRPRRPQDRVLPVAAVQRRTHAPEQGDTQARTSRSRTR